MATALECKELGNKAFAAKDFTTAIKHFTDGLEIDPSNHVLYSNRSACYSSIQEYEKALEDGRKTVECKPDFWKGYSRQGVPLYYLGRYAEAKEAYEAGLQVAPDNPTLKKGVEDCEQKMYREKATAGLAQIFGPDTKAVMRGDPALSGYLNDPAFERIIDEVCADQSALEKHSQDQRLMQVMLQLMQKRMGVNLPTENGSGGAAGREASAPPEPARPASPEPAPAEPTPAEPEVPGNEKEALEEKEKGNAAYAAKDFAKAHEHYAKAVELDPKNMVFVLNQASVYFAEKDFEKCVECCDKAVEVGRSVRCDFTQIGKAYHRKGRALMRLKRYGEAIEVLKKSLTEHRTAPVLKDLQQAEKLHKKAEAEAYFNPELAQEAKQRGNEFFKKQQYPEAVKEYTEAIKRNPKDPALYSNRAAAYTKLMAYTEALKDGDKCIELDPTFIKGYTRKALVYSFTKDYRKALSMYEAALKIDPNNPEVMQGYGQTMMKIQESRGDKATQERALQDPEIQEILREDRVQGILQLMKTDQMAAQRAISQNPELRKKFEVLMNAGLM
mmetsp:Transcript_27113/g.75786  ORF Transcript_27113/g.75786 Transcript_27113/m.75786 type:complete len:557 (-) Transcript_27113:51-1721(-)